MKIAEEKWNEIVSSFPKQKPLNGERSNLRDPEVVYRITTNFHVPPKTSKPSAEGDWI
jgi:hypothetical protein